MNDPIEGPGFSNVDRSANPGSFVNYLDCVGAESVMQWLERQILSRLPIEPGGRLLDIGCGTGDDVRAMAAMVGPDGWVVGIDSSEIMIAEAKRRSAGLSLPVEFRRGDGAALDFTNGTFDGCRTERVLQHVADPAAVLVEMVRVTRSGGRVVCLEPDWESLVIDAPDRTTTRAILNFRCDAYKSGWVGRQLPGLFKQAGLADVKVDLPSFSLTDFKLADALFELRSFADTAVKAGRLGAVAAAAWVKSLEEASAEGRFLAAFMPFLVSARKP